jgi:hypothetical protein
LARVYNIVVDTKALIYIMFIKYLVVYKYLTPLFALLSSLIGYDDQRRRNQRCCYSLLLLQSSALPPLTELSATKEFKGKEGTKGSDDAKAQRASEREAGRRHQHHPPLSLSLSAN